MFYFFLPSLMSFDYVLIASAVVPAVFLLIRTYRSDRLEKEPAPMLWGLAAAGVFSSLIARVEERVLCAILDVFLPQSHFLYDVILYFGIVAFAEESSKYLLLKKRTWNADAFNCQYDGVVYAVFVSLGFALWENISYVMAYGIGTALIRALTAIPGHACFGVFMGIFYGMAKRADLRGTDTEARLFRALALLVPSLLHGAYDYIATSEGGDLYFVGFIAVLFAVSFLLIGRMSKNDRYIR